MSKLAATTGQARRDVPLLPGGGRLLGHALELFFPFGQGIRSCIGEGFAWTEAILLLSAIAARWELRLADSAAVHPVAPGARPAPGASPRPLPAASTAAERPRTD